jgi:2-methylcitrate dehydratase PrpD
MTNTTKLLAAFVHDCNALPAPVATEATRAFVNFIGCALGGAHHDAVDRTVKAALPLANGGAATLLGRTERLGPLDAALVNCQASAAHAFDDTHLATVIHAAGPIAAPLLAEAERRPVTGAAFQTSFAVGIEVACRVGAMLTVPPADAQLGWYMTSVAGPIGAAAGVSRLLGLSEQQTTMALGLAAAGSAGFRQTHGSMCTSLLPGHGARSGYWAALLAEQDVTASDHTLEGANGFAQMFAPSAHLPHATDRLGDHWEMLSNVAKPYPCGIVIHPIIDGCLEIAGMPGFDATQIASIKLGVHPLCLRLTDRPNPPGNQLAQVSLQHWAAAVLVRAAAGIPEGADEAVQDPVIQSVRALIDAQPDASVGRDGAVVVVEMRDGARHERRIEHGIGSLDRPMTDAELDTKFMDQARLSITDANATMLLGICRQLPTLLDVRQALEARAQP